ncbi:MAG: hypothetical protein EHM42_12750, partial [Planctomycetaceae bacterium]
MNNVETNDVHTLNPGCAAAREALDLDRPGEPVGEGLAPARQHLAVCPECHEVVRLRSLFDARVARLCQDVDAPIGGRERLLAALATARSAVEPAASR